MSDNKLNNNTDINVDKTYLRGQVSKLTGLNIETLRFYEQNGLIPAPKRTNGGYRIYTDDTINRLEFIKLAKNSGFKLVEIKHFFSIFDDRIPDQQFVSVLLEKKINEIDRNISELNEMRLFLLNIKDKIVNLEKCTVMKSLLRK